jgi:phosphoribosylanthranilate isomerase
MNQTTMQRISGTLRLPKHRVPANPTATGKHVDLTHPSDSNKTVMPHERDEQVGMTGGVASPMVEQAARDLKRGIKDTSRSVEADAAYKKLKSS